MSAICRATRTNSKSPEHERIVGNWPGKESIDMVTADPYVEAPPHTVKGAWPRTAGLLDQQRWRRRDSYRRDAAAPG